jgi:hypothetical protein
MQKAMWDSVLPEATAYLGVESHHAMGIFTHPWCTMEMDLTSTALTRLEPHRLSSTWNMIILHHATPHQVLLDPE